MTQSLITPQQKKPLFRRVTIVLPVDSKMPVIDGKWTRLPNGNIRAWYSLDEYEKCLNVAERAGIGEADPGHCVVSDPHSGVSHCSDR